MADKPAVHPDDYSYTHMPPGTYDHTNQTQSKGAMTRIADMIYNAVAPDSGSMFKRSSDASEAAAKEAEKYIR